MPYLVRRILTLLLTVLFVVLLTFSVFRIIPGNPALTILGPEASDEQIALLEAKLGTDRPLPEQFASWMRGVAGLDFGDSLRFSEPVLHLIGSRFPVTLSLALLALLLTTVTAIPLGIAAARSKGKAVDIIISIGSQIGLAIPSFWMGIILILLFALTLKWFSVSAYVPWSENPLLAFKSLLLPSVALALPQIAIVVRYLRTTMLEQLHLDYVRTARSKGLKESTVYYKHVLKNALLPVVTIVGINFGELLAGSLVVEQVFTLPGLGGLLITGIGNRDYPLVQGMVLMIAFIVITTNFIVDLSYRWLDPKIRLK
ncbi:ABC transporter permease [Paenibacillus validus]|uniref:ABC transporter permease subunit n=1 Tax=Paenibacillus validus TaxID=44253 RepID=A0A7X2ZCA2_9BACL|nr:MULTISPECIES: ABC transporter permease [Paenibacillus]MED4599195.1 ABC transporter permease [Paenibacillus validus]MED4606498.1 ABC transporter permease [Paenibacillus validus]MUG71558.1 ABC transporter permease subunit [Paenibacillus validus]